MEPRHLLALLSLLIEQKLPVSHSCSNPLWIQRLRFHPFDWSETLGPTEQSDLRPSAWRLWSFSWCPRLAWKCNYLVSQYGQWFLRFISSMRGRRFQGLHELEGTGGLEQSTQQHPVHGMASQPHTLLLRCSRLHTLSHQHVHILAQSLHPSSKCLSTV